MKPDSRRGACGLLLTFNSRGITKQSPKPNFYFNKVPPQMNIVPSVLNGLTARALTLGQR